MKRIFNIFALSAMCMALLAGCNNELVDTEQYAKSGVVLNVYGPQPVMRGGQLRFLGSNLDKITEVIIPGVSPITDIEVVKAGVPSEIRVIVPKDGPEPGLVTLKTSDGKEIVTKTELTYSEPIVLESFSPASVKAGDVLTIKGDYFNLIHEVIFSEDIKVSEKDFSKHTRYEIEVKVPAEARSGKIGLGDIDELNSEEDVLPNVIYSEEELVVAAPEVTKMSAPRYKAGETVTITGRNLDLVATIELAGAKVTDFKVASGNASLTFVLPAEAGDGAVVLVAVSGVEVEAGEIVAVVPTGLAAAPQPVKAEGTLAISGKDLDLVTAVELPNAGEVEFTADGDITLTMPETAQEGMAILKMANGKSVEAAFTLVKPAGFEYSANPAAAGSDITVTGTDLDLVKSVTFGGNLTVEVEAEETSITVAVPTTAASGVLKFNLANGTSVEGGALEVEKPTACFITELPEEGTEIYGGTVLVVPVENEDKLTGVEVNGASVNFLLNGKTLYISLPDMAGKDTVIRLVSSNGAVEYTVDCIPNNIQNKVIWSGSWSCLGWKGNTELAWGGFDWTTIDLSAGTVSLVFDITRQDQSAWACLSLRTGTSWEEFSTPIKIEIPEGATTVEVPFTQAMLDEMLNDNGLVLTGDNYTLTKITVRTVMPTETTIWEGEETVTGWSAIGFLTDGGAEFTSNGITVGSTIWFYFTPLEDDWKVQIIEGHWGSTYTHICAAGSDTDGGNYTEYDLAANGGRYGLTVTEEIYAAATTSQNWGNIFLINSNNVKVTKITFE